MESDRFPTVSECEENLCYYQGHPNHCHVKDCPVREQALTKRRSDNMNRIKDIEKYGKSRRGKTDLIRYLRGRRLTRSQAIQGKCYDCTAYGQEKDCPNLDCSLWPYRKGKEQPNPLNEDGK